MKLWFIFSLFSLLFAAPVWSNNGAQSDSQQTFSPSDSPDRTPASNDSGGASSGEAAQGTLEANTTRLEFVLENGPTKIKFDECKQIWGSESLDENVSECIWEGKIKDQNGNPITDPSFALTDDDKESVTAALESVSDEYKGDADKNKDKFESLDNGFLKEAKKDPAFKKLNDYMSEKLKKEIYGEAEQGKLKVADHMVYHDMYKSQLSKNVIQAMSSYCLDADIEDELFLIPESDVASKNKELKDIRKANIDRLKSTEMKQQQTAGSNEVKEVPIANYYFTKCISSLKHICYGTGQIARIKNRTESDINDEIDNLGNNTNINETQKQARIAQLERELVHIKRYPESKTRACNVATYIKQLKQNIIALDGIKKKMDDVGIARGSGVKLGLDSSQQLQEFDSNRTEEITTLTSKEFVEESGFKDASDEAKMAFEKCMNEQGDIQDSSACQKFINDDKAKREEAAKLIAEADIRSRGMQKRIEDNVTGEEGVTKYLTDQGYTEEEISKMKDDPNLMGNIEKQINDRFKAEREAYIASIRNKLKSKTVEDDKGLSANSSSDTKTKLENIREELTSRTDRYTELIHFNNIVSGFIETEDEDGNSGANTTGMALELAGSAYGAGDARGRTPGSNDPSGGAEAHVKAIEEALKTNGVSPEVQQTSNTIKQSDINKILEYEGVSQD